MVTAPDPPRPSVSVPAPAASAAASGPAPILATEKFTVRYNGHAAVKEVDIAIRERTITAIIGPSGCGKSTLLRSFNRMNDFVPGVTIEGRALFHDADLHAPSVDPVEVRRRIGMVFQKPNPFPKSIFRNVAWGPAINGYRGNMQQLVETSLRKAALWDEVKDRLHDSALALSGGQQQRLCIARAIAMEPEVILMDEPCSALDPTSTSRIEDLICELKERYTILIVTHNMQQAARVSDLTAFFCDGHLVEYGPAKEIFTTPRQKKTEDYITGRFG